MQVASGASRSRTPGAWTGKMLWTNEIHPKKGILPEKWKIQRADLLKLKQLIQDGLEVERKFFLSLTCRGMSQTEVYMDIRPYFKSFYNALEAWRPNRDPNGWKLPGRDIADCDELSDDESLSEEDFEMADARQSPPPTVTITEELVRDLDTLLLFYEEEEPVFLPLRPCNPDDYVYLCGDASAAGYAAGIQRPDGTTTVTLGNWTDVQTARGSNWREARNLALAFLRDVRSGRLDGKEVWALTDNLVFSIVSNKGMSKSIGLTDIVRDIKYECRKHNVFWHGLHISGKRMIKIGYDGGSRGDFDTGVMLGADICDLVPLALPAVKNIKRRNPRPKHLPDELFICQSLGASIDAFWSRTRVLWLTILPRSGGNSIPKGAWFLCTTAIGTLAIGAPSWDGSGYYA
eukprot:CCRYP_011249-RA/>CCRYP_011249-RA protein AED:0.25 eAED:0.25 QI:0/0/0/0.5/1/1/2/0/403